MNDWIGNAVDASGRAHFGSDFGSIFSKIGHALSKATQGVAKGVNSVGKALGKIPVVGSGLHAVYDLGVGGPISLSASIASGHRVDKAAMASLKATVKDVKDVAPYVTTVISIVPGVGQTVGAAIGAASALASGKSVTQALLEAAKGAIPGGAIAAASFEIASAGVQGKNISTAALSLLPLNDDQKKMVVAAVHAARDIAHGKKVDESVFNAGKALLPPDAQKALVVGVALAHAKNLQDLAAKGAHGAMEHLPAMGKAKVLATPVLKAGLAHITHPEQKTGFLVGAGLMSHTVNRTELNTIRGRLSPPQKQGFDVAVSAHIGSLTHPLPATIPPAKQFAFQVTHGMANAKPENKAAVTELLSSHPDLHQGMIAAKTNQKIKFLEKVRLYIIHRRIASAGSAAVHH